MATKIESDFPSSPPNDESGGEEQDDSIEDEIPEQKPTNNNVQDLLKRLQSTGALIKKPKQELHCFTCKEDFDCWEDLEQHLISHVSLPSVVLDKLPSDDEDIPSGDEEWSDEEEAPSPPKTAAKTPQKVDISQLLKKTGLTFKKPTEAPKTANAALDKLSGLGFTIKKNISPIKKEIEIKNEPTDSKESQQKSNDVLQKLGNLGGIKLKLSRADGSNGNNFKVVNGLKDFKTSDEEDEDEEIDKNITQDGDSDEELEKPGEHEGSGPEDSDDEDIPQDAMNKTIVAQAKQTNLASQKMATTLKNLQGKTVIPKLEPQQSPTKPIKPAPVVKTPSKDSAPPLKPIAVRPNIKQTPKRGANLPLPAKESLQIKEISSPGTASSNSTPERRTSNDTGNVLVKKELETPETNTAASSVPLFSSSHIKTEATSPPPDKNAPITPIIASVKSEPEPESAKTSGQSQPIFTSQPTPTTPLLPVTKTEDTGVTIIEINGDSNDEDDDCCVVSATPASDVKPILPKTEPLQPSYPPPAYPVTQSSYATTLPPTSRASVSSLEKQHNFDWNAPDSKPAVDVFDKSADEIFESLLSNATKKENMMSDASEYISLDTLGPQHSCDVCNTRFTDVSLLENHIRMTGHSRSIITPSSASSLMPYNPGSSSILSSLLPVKQMVEQVGKMGMGSSSGFTHQQNVMINIQAYPGAGGMMQGQPAYNSYGQPMPQQTMPGYSQPAPGYPAPGQQMPGQFPNQNFMGQQPYGQFQPPKDNYASAMPQNSFDNTMYSSSPLQSMQQAVYGQPPTSMGSQIGQMGPPPVPTSNPYAPSSSPGGMKPPTSGSGIRIQNIQTFPPGQTMGMSGQSPDGQNLMQPPAPGQVMGGQMQSPGQIRMAAGANVTGPRPRMPGVRGQRPGLRPGVQVHGQIRGSKPGVRMPMKRPGVPGQSPVMKKRPNILLPGKHDNEDCQVMAMQKQREGMPMIKSVQGAGDKLNLGSQISITKKTVNKEANAMANVLASRGISVKQKQKSRSPSPDRPLPHIPNLGAGMSIKHTSKSSSFSIPEAKVGGGMLQCRICKKMFMNANSLSVHMSSAHSQSKVPMFKCEECPASYPKILQLQHHKRVFHNVVGPNRELGLPVVDMSQEDNLSKLSSLGIYSYIPLSSRDQGGGTFGIPIISVHNMQNGITNNLHALGADGLLSLGPMKPLPNT